MGNLRGGALQNRRISELSWRSTVLLVVMFMANSGLCNAQGFESGRWRVIPSLRLSAQYDDNVYLDDEGEKSDSIGSVEPGLKLDFAIVPRSYFELAYAGEYKSYTEADNFRGYRHSGGISFTGRTHKGSELNIGWSGDDDALQPYSPYEQSKDFIYQNVYGNAVLAGDITEIGAGYSHENRWFERPEFSQDDYLRDTWDVSLVSHLSSVFPLLLQHRYVRYKDKGRVPAITNYYSHSYYIGARWRSERRLSGALRVGYLTATFDIAERDKFEGLAVDTTLSYELSPITHLEIRAERTLEATTQSSREDGDYYVLVNIGMTVSYHKWARISSQLKLSYINRDFKNIGDAGSIRTDDLYIAGLQISYALYDWLSILLDYQYTQNESDITNEKYTNNVVGLTFSISM